MRANKQFARLAAFSLVLGLGAAGAGNVLAAEAGSVEYTHGVGTILHGGQSTRILAAGAPLNEGDVIATGATSYAIVKFNDGSRVTVRPDSQLQIQSFTFIANARDDQPAGGMVFNLLKGGLRALTGLIPKHDSNGALIHTPVATVGIRGTDFDLRLCDVDCEHDAVAERNHAERKNVVLASARIVALQGSAGATNANGVHRILASGGPVYPGDLIDTAAGSDVVIVFRDESRMTVQPSTRMKVEDFVYDRAQPGEGRLLVNLVKGGLRAFTGIIGKFNHQNENIHTAVATVGIRGTGIDLQCLGTCASEPGAGQDDGMKATVWDGSIELIPTAGGGIEIDAGQTGTVNSQGLAALGGAPLQYATPRPDSIQVNMDELFGLKPLTEGQPGLYVVVRDGHVSIATASDTLNLGIGETGYTDGTILIRPVVVPVFMNVDPTPLPGRRLSSLALLGLLQDAGIKYQCGP